MVRIMFLVLDLAFQSAQGYPSREAYPTLEACEAALPDRLEEVRKTFADSDLRYIVIDGGCYTDGDPA